MMRHRASHQRRSRESGYTLLELLIASVLIATLMAAAWSLLSLYGDFLVAGRSQAAEQQLARSLMDLLASDLRSLVGQPSTPMPTNAAGISGPTRPGSAPRTVGRLRSDLFETAGEQPESPFGDNLEAAIELPAFSLRGDGQSLTLIAARSQPDLTRASLAGEDERLIADEDIEEAAQTRRRNDLPGPARAAQWTQVIYRFEPPRATTPDEEALPPGLHRFEVPVEFLGLLSESNPTNAGFSEFPRGALTGPENELPRTLTWWRARGVTEITHEWIPEVVACRFEFLDGPEWRTDWDSEWEQRDPPAVRIRLKLLSPQEREELMRALGSLDAESMMDSDAVAAVPSDSPRSIASDPSVAFHPREFERIVLLEGVRRVNLPDAREEGGEDSLTGSSQLLIGGEP